MLKPMAVKTTTKAIMRLVQLKKTLVGTAGRYGFGDKGGSPSRKAPLLGVVPIFSIAACSAVAIDVAGEHAGQRMSPAEGFSACTDLPQILHKKSNMAGSSKAHTRREHSVSINGTDQEGTHSPQCLPMVSDRKSTLLNFSHR